MTRSRHKLGRRIVDPVTGLLTHDPNDYRTVDRFNNPARRRSLTPAGSSSTPCTPPNSTGPNGRGRDGLTLTDQHLAARPAPQRPTATASTSAQRRISPPRSSRVDEAHMQVLVDGELIECFQQKRFPVARTVRRESSFPPPWI